ncbi:MAG: S8 family serine peptidase, partial [Saprospiraceae bacterium]
MMTNLSGLGYVTAFGALMFWVVASEYNRSGKWLVRIFLLGFILYFSFLILQDYSGAEKLEDLARDLMIMGFATWLLQFLFHKNKILGFGGFALLLAALLLFYLPHFFLLTRQISKMESVMDPNGEWLIQLKESHSIGELSALFANNVISFTPAFTMAEPENTDLDDFVVANYTGQDAEEFAELKRKILDSDLVEALEENELMTLDDPVASQKSALINNEYGLNDPLINQQWAWKNFQMQNYYQTLGTINAPSKPIILAILDTGIDTKHEDLKDVTISVADQNDSDPKGHGTHCACIAGARSNNGVGIASFQLDKPFYKLMSIKVLNSNGSG